MCVVQCKIYIYMYIYREIKEIRTQLSIAAYLFASRKQHVDPPFFSLSPTSPTRPPPTPQQTPASAIPNVDVCLTVGSWVIFYANCKLSVKIVVIGLIQQCQPKCLAESSAVAWKDSEKEEKQLRKLQKQQKISRTGNSKY